MVFDSSARLPLDSQLVRSTDVATLTSIVSTEAPAERVTALRDAGADVIAVPGDRGQRVSAALAVLGRHGITSLLLEGGAELAGSFLDAGEVDELRLFIAPVVLGGEGSRPLAAGEGVKGIDEATRALAMDWERSGDDLLIQARLREW